MNNPSKEFELIRLYPQFSADPLIGRTGEMYYNTTSNSIRVCTSPAPTWVDVGSGANTDLSNLIATQINMSLNPGVPYANLLSLGTTALPWLAASITGVQDISSIIGLLGFGLSISTQDVLGVTNSDGLNLITGNSVDGTTGSVQVTTGTPSGSASVFASQISDFSSVVFSYSTAVLGTEQAGISFVAGSDATLASILYKIKNATATPDTFDTQVYVYDDFGGEPNALIGQSALYPVALAGSATANQTYPFTTPIPIVAGNTYYVLLAAQGFASTLDLLGSATDITGEDFTTTIDTGANWITAAFPDPYFTLFSSPARGSLDISASAERLLNQTPLKFMDADNSNYVAFKAANLIPMNVTWILPTSDGTSGQTMVTNGAGVLSWAQAGAFNKKQLFVLTGTDITNQYIDLLHVARTDSIQFYIQGDSTAIEGASYDYSVSYTGGAGGNTRITFLNDLATGGATPLASSDVVVVMYEY